MIKLINIASLRFPDKCWHIDPSLHRPAGRAYLKGERGPRGGGVVCPRIGTIGVTSLVVGRNPVFLSFGLPRPRNKLSLSV